MVRSGFVIACRLATSPTRISPDLEKATTEGVVRAPSALGMTVGSPPSRTATTELVVPRSIPTAFAICFLLVSYLSVFQCANLSAILSTLDLRDLFPRGLGRKGSDRVQPSWG